MPTAAELFREELKLFATNKEAWLATHDGRFVLLKGSEVIGFFESFEQATQVGLNKYGPSTSFFVKQILKDDSVLRTPALVAGLLFARL